MKVNDLAFLDIIYSKTLKTLNTNDVLRLREEGFVSLENLLSLLKGYDVVNCIYSNIKFNADLSIDDIFSCLTNCWFDELVNMCRSTMVSKEAISFVETYIVKHVITYLIMAIRYLRGESVRKPVVIIRCLEDIEGINTLSTLYDSLKLCKGINVRVLMDVLHKYRELRLVDIDVDTLYRQLMDSYWRYLLMYGKLLNPRHNLIRVLELLKDLESLNTLIRRKLILSEDLNDVMRRYDYSVFKILLKALQSDIPTYDVISSLLIYYHATTLLRYSPLSYDVLLHYLMLKEWEAIILSFIIYGLSYDLSTYVQKFLDFWVSAYASLKTY